MATSYLYGGVHPTLSGYSRGPGLAGDPPKPIPGLTVARAADAPVTVLSAPALPIAGAAIVAYAIPTKNLFWKGAAGVGVYFALSSLLNLVVRGNAASF